MAPRTRRATRKDLSMSTSLATTPTRGASPTFSSRMSPEVTPDTSEPDEEAKVSTKRIRSYSATKQGSSSSAQKHHYQHSEVIEPASKRRRTVYVEIIRQKAQVWTSFSSLYAKI